MGSRAGTTIVVILVLLALAASANWLSDLAILPFVVALHLLERFLYWFNVVWRL